MEQKEIDALINSALKKAENNLRILVECPFCADHPPSCVIDVNKQMFYCMQCETSGAFGVQDATEKR
jgi:transcription elongation factor Elf1